MFVMYNPDSPTLLLHIVNSLLLQNYLSVYFPNTPLNKKKVFKFFPTT